MEDLATQVDVEAEYTLEAPVRCAGCQKTVSNLLVVRLLRTRVNFTSALPRRGYAVVCPSCSAVVSAKIGR